MTVSCENAALVPASARNRPPFTIVHSHSPAQKSSGAFFHDTDRERCRKRPSGSRSALRGFTGVRARDVMFNRSGRHKKAAFRRLSLFTRFTRIRAFSSYSSVVVAITGLRAAAGFRYDYIGVKWSSVRHGSIS